MRRFELLRAAEYGTGAVVDYKSGEAEDGAAIILFVAPDRGWGISRFGLVTKPSVGTDDESSRAGFDRAVDRYLDAIKTRDCKAFLKTAFVQERPKEFCKTSFQGSAVVAERLKANPQVEPRYEGGNQTYGFYSLETPKPQLENSTISVIKDGSTFLVLDITPSATSADQRRAAREMRQSAKKARE